MKIYLHETIAAQARQAEPILRANLHPEQLFNTLFYFGIIIVLQLGFSLMVGRAARSYGRSATAWFFLSLAFNPLVAWIFLLVANVPHSTKVAPGKEMAGPDRAPDPADLRTAAKQETTCENCGAPVNPVTGEGLSSSELEPWRLFCDRCRAEIKAAP